MPATAPTPLAQRMRSSFSASSPATVAVKVADPDPTAVAPVSSVASLTDTQKLDIFEEVLDGVEASAVDFAPIIAPVTTPTIQAPAQPQLQPQQPQLQAQPQPQVTQSHSQPQPQADSQPQPIDQLNPPSAVAARGKERADASISPDAAGPDVGANIQYVEHEKAPEIPVEVESFLQHVENHSTDQSPQVVIADGSIENATTQYPTRPVIVLPITQEEEQKNKRKSTKYSVRWLVEWSRKIMKMFAGKVVYRDA